MSETVVETRQANGGVFENLIEVFYAPAKVFARSQGQSAWPYVLITTAVVAIVLFATRNLMDPWMQAQADFTIAQSAKSGQAIPEAQQGAMRAGMSWSIIGVGVVATLVGPLFNGLLLILGGKVAGARLSFAQAFLIATLGGVPRLLTYFVWAAQGALLNPATARSLADLSLSPARFLDPNATTPMLLTLLGGLDVTRVWQLVATGIGVAVVARVSRGNGWFAAFIMLALGTALTLIPAALTG